MSERGPKTGERVRRGPDARVKRLVRSLFTAGRPLPHRVIEHWDPALDYGRREPAPSDEPVIGGHPASAVEIDQPSVGLSGHGTVEQRGSLQAGPVTAFTDRTSIIPLHDHITES